MFIALLLLGTVAVSYAKNRYGTNHAKNSPYHPLEHNSDAQSSNSQSSSSLKSGDNIKHDPKVYKKNYKAYDSWSESEIEPKRNEALFVARTLSVKTKKYIKNQLHKGTHGEGSKPWEHHEWKAYCEGPTAARCELFVCYATQAIVNHEQFGKHLSQKAVCPPIRGYPDMHPSKIDKHKSPLNKEYRLINPHGLLVWLKAQYTEAKKLCHKTTHTTDDRCKAEVLCATLEIFTETWPQIFKLQKCGIADFLKRDPRSIKKKNLNKSDYKDFPRLYHKKHQKVPLLPSDKTDLETRFNHHHRSPLSQRGYSHESSSSDSSSSSSSSDSSSSGSSSSESFSALSLSN